MKFRCFPTGSHHVGRNTKTKDFLILPFQWQHPLQWQYWRMVEILFSLFFPTTYDWFTVLIIFHLESALRANGDSLVSLRVGFSRSLIMCAAVFPLAKLSTSGFRSGFDKRKFINGYFTVRLCFGRTISGHVRFAENLD